MYNMDFSGDKPDIRKPIPANTPLLLRMVYTPGGANIPGTPQAQCEGALTASNNSDALYLKAEFTVLRGPYKGRKIWNNLTVYGGKLDEKGQSKAGAITRKTIRAIIDSSLGLKSTDESPDANAKRVLPNGFRDLQGRVFVAKARVEKEQNGYPERNSLGTILTVDMKGFPSEQELDNPTAAQTDAPAAIPAPNWGDSQSPQAPATAAAPQQTTAAPAPVQQPPAAPQAATPPTGQAIPEWMKQAAA